MTAVTPDYTAAHPALTAGSWGGHVINILFATTVALFFVGLFAIGPVV